MLDIIRDPMWQFIGAIFALVGIFVASAIYVVQRQRKTLSYEIVSRTSLLSMTDELEGKLQILFQGEPVHKVHLLVVRIINTGNVPIVPTDYVRNPSLKFGNTAKVLSGEVSETNPENLSASLIVDSHTITFEPVLLNSGDSITMKSLISEFDGKVEVDARIVGVKQIQKQEETLSSVFVPMTLGLILVLAGFVADFIIFPKAQPVPTTDMAREWPFFAVIVVGLLLYSVVPFRSRRVRRGMRVLLRRTLFEAGSKGN